MQWVISHEVDLKKNKWFNGLRKTCNISHEVDLKKNLKWFISHEVDLKKICKWFIYHEVDLKKNLQMVHIS